MDILDFYKTNYRVSFLRILRQYWKDEKKWNCIGAPKLYHMFLYLDGCSTVYTQKDGKKIHAHSGDSLFIPKGMEYSVEFFDFENDRSSTVNINFNLYDSNGNIENTFDNIIHFSSSDVRLCINELERQCLSLDHIPTKCDVEVYKIFNYMGDYISKKKNVKNNFETIRKGVEYLHFHYNENVGISELASICNISEVYFRKLFKELMGVSPSEYRQTLRLEHACRYLKYGENSISEIAEILGYVDTSYFVKNFREKYGITPLNYRKQS